LRQGRKQRRKRGGGKSNRGSIKNRVSIDERPGIIDTQQRIGDWEGDTIIGRNHKQPLATFVERKSLYTTADFMEDKRAFSLNDAALRAFAHVPATALETLTVDNGK
jgi:IS30 family transposase